MNKLFLRAGCFFSAFIVFSLPSCGTPKEKSCAEGIYEHLLNMGAEHRSVVWDRCDFVEVSRYERKNQEPSIYKIYKKKGRLLLWYLRGIDEISFNPIKETKEQVFDFSVGEIIDSDLDYTLFSFFAGQSLDLQILCPLASFNENTGKILKSNHYACTGVIFKKSNIALLKGENFFYLLNIETGKQLCEGEKLFFEQFHSSKIFSELRAVSFDNRYVVYQKEDLYLFDIKEKSAYFLWKNLENDLIQKIIFTSLNFILVQTLKKIIVLDATNKLDVKIRKIKFNDVITKIQVLKNEQVFVLFSYKIIVYDFLKTNIVYEKSIDSPNDIDQFYFDNEHLVLSSRRRLMFFSCKP